jgi:hypothetical protein
MVETRNRPGSASHAGSYANFIPANEGPNRRTAFGILLADEISGSFKRVEQMTDPQQYGARPSYQGAPYQGAPTPPPPAPPAPVRNMRRRRVIALVVLAVVAVGITLAALSAQGSNPDSAKVDDCVSKPDNNSVKVVGCGDSSAAFRVAGKVEHKTQVDVSLNSATICKPFPNATSAYWKGEIGKPGYVLCLAPVK